jgi:hypothetical protein
MFMSSFIFVKVCVLFCVEANTSMCKFFLLCVYICIATGYSVIERVVWVPLTGVYVFSTSKYTSDFYMILL